MTAVGFHASHEQAPPSALLASVRHAEEAGFDTAMCSDHLAPWSERQGHSGHAWTWLGAALATTSLPFGVVTAPGQRYHPVMTAQAIATLGELFPGRFWAALGSGEAINEHVTGDRWPGKPTRDARLLECVAVMRALLAGEEVTHDGLIRVDLAIAHDQWRTNVFSSDLAWNLELPAQFDAAATYVRPEDVRSAVLVSSDLAAITAKLQAIVELGVDGLALHHVGQDQERFIDAFGSKVLPELAS